MAEVKNLDFQFSVGWEKSGGKSNNVWGTVPFPPELLKYINEYKSTPIYVYDARTGEQIKKENNKPSVWTAYDDFIYTKFGHVVQKDLPRISATFKSCFGKYSAVVENLGMRLAMELDMPTSYNEIVAFDPKEYPKIVANYPNQDKIKNLQPVGIVSIDFLQNKKISPKYSKTDMSLDSGKTVEISSINTVEGDKLVSFEDAVRKYLHGVNNLSGEENLIENWITAVDEMARKELKNCPRELVNKKISHVHGRIARAFLLREFLGDCDFTAYNGGVVINDATKDFSYAPNHDYGESFNALTKIKLEFDPLCGMTQEVFDKLPENLKEKIRETKEKESRMSVSDVAKTFASSTSEQNLHYVLNNFPEACDEFFENLDKLAQSGKFNTIVDSYTDMTVNGQPLLSKDDAKMFKEYIVERSSHMSLMYIDHLQSQGRTVPQVVVTELEKE